MTNNDIRATQSLLLNALQVFSLLVCISLAQSQVRMAETHVHWEKTLGLVETALYASKLFNWRYLVQECPEKSCFNNCNRKACHTRELTSLGLGCKGLPFFPLLMLIKDCHKIKKQKQESLEYFLIFSSLSVTSNVYIYSWFFNQFPPFFQPVPETGSAPESCCTEGIVRFRSAHFCLAGCCPGHSEVTENITKLSFQIAYCVRDDGKLTRGGLKALNNHKRLNMGKRKFPEHISLEYVIRMIK